MASGWLPRHWAGGYKACGNPPPMGAVISLSLLPSPLLSTHEHTQTRSFPTLIGEWESRLRLGANHQALDVGISVFTRPSYLRVLLHVAGWELVGGWVPEGRVYLPCTVGEVQLCFGSSGGLMKTP